jgi:predicted adenylyl cyclase CyaB
MPSNVEIKARVRDPAGLRERAAALADGPCTELRQEDAFFPVPTGRLKLRRIEGRGAELIFYQRADRLEAAVSTYRRTPVQDPDGLAETLGEALGADVVVRKVRGLFHVGRTRIHVDEVEGLGHYMELEVVLREGERADEGAREAARIATQLGIEEHDYVQCAYADLLRSRAADEGR